MLMSIMILEVCMECHVIGICGYLQVFIYFIKICIFFTLVFIGFKSAVSLYMTFSYKLSGSLLPQC